MPEPANLAGTPDDAATDSTPSFRDPALERRFSEEGFVKLRILPSDAAIAIAGRIARLYPHGVEANQPQSNWYLGLIDDDRELALRSAKLVRDAIVPSLAPLFAHARCHYASVAIKPGGAGATPIHQHWPTTIDPFARRIACWVLLSDRQGSAARFRLVPRSQRILPYIRHSQSGDYFDGFSEQVERRHARDLELSPGEAVLFEDSILHGTGANPGQQMRVAALANFVGADMGTAALLPDGDDAFAVIDTGGRDGMAEFLETGEWPESWRPVSRIANRNRAISEEEFVRLLAGNEAATLDHDPLDAIRSPRSRFSRIVRRAARLAGRWTGRGALG